MCCSAHFTQFYRESLASLHRSVSSFCVLLIFFFCLGASQWLLSAFNATSFDCLIQTLLPWFISEETEAQGS